jgi:hypothetical protein
VSQPKDAEFLNFPIRFYTEMEAIFGHSMATGKYAIGSSEALGAVVKTEGAGETIDIPSSNTKPTELITNSLGCGKRKRGAFSED